VVPAPPEEVFRWFVRPELLVRWIGIPVPPSSSTVTVDLLEHSEGTLVRLVHRDLAPKVRRLHAEGWSRFMPRLAAVVAGRDPGADPARDGLPPALQR
jgi:hypothetical protein